MPSPARPRTVRRLVAAALAALLTLTGLATAASADDEVGTVTGRVVDSAGAPVVGVPVELTTTMGMSTGAAVLTDAQGGYTVGPVAPGTYLVHVMPPGDSPLLEGYHGGSRAWEATWLSVTAGATTQVGDTVLQTAAIVEGRVLAAGQPVSTAFVSLTTTSGSGGGFSSTWTDGTFRIKAPAGDYRVQVTGPWGSGLMTTYWPGTQDQTQAGVVTAVAGRSTALGDIAMTTGATITGTVTGPDGAPVAGVSVWATRQSPGFSSMATTAPDGTYAIGGLVAGEYQLQFRPAAGSGLRSEYFDGVDDWASATPVAVTAGGTTARVDASLRQGVCLTGVVRSAAGGPVSGALVLLHPADGGTASPHGTTGFDGTFRVSDAAPGDYLLEVSTWNDDLADGFYPGSTGRDDATVLTLAAGDCVDVDPVTMPVGGTITGRLLAVDGTPTAGNVTVTSDDGAYGSATAGPDGRFVVRGLASGDYVVQASAFGGGIAVYHPGVPTRADAETVRVALGEDTATGDLRIVAGGTLTGTAVKPDGSGFSSELYVTPVGGGYDDTLLRYVVDGAFTAGDVVPGRHILSVVAESRGSSGLYDGVTTYYDGGVGTQQRSKAVPLDVAVGQTVDGLHLVVPPRGTAAAQVTAASSPQPAPVGRPATVRVTVTGDDATPTGAVGIYGPTGFLGDALLEDGRADVTFTVPDVEWATDGGTPQIGVEYVGDAVHDRQYVSVPFAVTTSTDPEPAPPTVSSVDPAAGSALGGTQVVVTGSGFVGTPEVTFGGVAATGVVVESPTALRATVPAHAAGPAPVVVTTDRGASDGAVAYTYEHVPTATTLTATPATVPSGGSVTLTATVAAAGIVPGGAVAFTVAGGQPRTVPLVDGTASLTVTAGTAGTQVVAATFVGDTTFASSTSTLDLVVTPAAVKPVLTAALPPVACTAGGTTVLLVGRNLTGTTGVTFGSTAAATFRVVSDTAVSVRVPAHAAGKAEVRLTTPGGTTKAVPFVYVAPPRGATCPKVAPVS